MCEKRLSCELWFGLKSCARDDCDVHHTSEVLFRMCANTTQKIVDALQKKSAIAQCRLPPPLEMTYTVLPLFFFRYPGIASTISIVSTLTVQTRRSSSITCSL